MTHPDIHTRCGVALDWLSDKGQMPEESDYLRRLLVADVLANDKLANVAEKHCRLLARLKTQNAMYRAEFDAMLAALTSPPPASASADTASTAAPSGEPDDQP